MNQSYRWNEALEMEIRQLQTFKVVAEREGFTRAAEELGYAQSSITAQIQALEQELGTPLFDRLGKRIVLTSAGTMLLKYAVELLDLHERAKQSVLSGPDPSGTLSIGAPESLAVYRLPEVIRAFKERYPQVKMVLKPGQCWELKSLLKRGELDVAFLLNLPETDSDVNSEVLVWERMSLVAAPGHPLTEKDQITAADLKSETMLQTEAGCSYRGLFESYLQRQGIAASQVLEFWNLEAIKQCAMLGLGIALLPELTVQKEIAKGQLAALEWDDQDTRVATQVVTHKKKWMSPALKEFVRMVSQHSASWRMEQEELQIKSRARS